MLASGNMMNELEKDERMDVQQKIISDWSEIQKGWKQSLTYKNTVKVV